jgi:hypothetical protein
VLDLVDTDEEHDACERVERARLPARHRGAQQLT